LAHQGFSHEFGKIKCLASFKGKDLIGAAVKAPLTKYDKIYVWPMFSVSTAKTTGVVTSVPSDSPDDYVAWRGKSLAII
jgi:leucyl-tRNA synthetase